MHDLRILDTGSLWWSPNGSLPAVPHPVYAYLISTRSQRRVLIDSGNPRLLIGEPLAHPWFDSRVEMTPEHDVRRQLGRHNVSIDQIDLLVTTHLHFDHCGNHDLFDGSEIPCVIHEIQYRSGQSDDESHRRLWDRPGIVWDCISGDYEIEPGFTLLETPGHCDGHLSVFVETPDGPVILAIDAIDDPVALGEGPFPSFYWDDYGAWRSSQRRLLKLQESTGATLYLGHHREPIPADRNRQ